MNETSPRKTTNAGRNNPRAGNIAAPAATKSPGKPDSKLDFPLDAAKVHAIFRNDTSVRQAITANLKKRSAESKVIAERARAAFKNFDPSNLSRAERTRRNYVAPGGQLAKTQLAVINRGVEAIRSSKIKPSITIHNSGELKDLIKETPGTDPSLVGTMELEPFFNFITLRPDASPSPVYTLCKAELDGQKKLDEIQIPALPKDNDESTGDDSPLKPRTASKLVEDTVNLQMETATSPEAQLQVLPHTQQCRQGQGSKRSSANL